MSRGIDLSRGDCLDVMRGMPDASVDLILTDPPYHRVKAEAWDRQWKTDGEYLDWIGRLCGEWRRLLRPNGSLYCFASPRMAARVECKIGEAFSVLNQIVWKKGDRNGNGTHSRQHKDDCRSWFPQTERIIFAEHRGADSIALGESGWAAKCDEARGFVFEPLRAYLAAERDRAGWTTRRVAEAFQRKTGSRTVTRMAGHWFEAVQWALPTAENYAWLRGLFNAGGGDYLRRDYDDLRAEYESLRRPFAVSAAVPHTDVWDFPTVPARPGKHPCEKPLPLVAHIVAASSRPGAVVLDCFAGSGVVGKACRDLGRDCILIEQDPAWCEAIDSWLGEGRGIPSPARPPISVPIRRRPPGIPPGQLLLDDYFGTRPVALTTPGHP